MKLKCDEQVVRVIDYDTESLKSIIKDGTAEVYDLYNLIQEIVNLDYLPVGNYLIHFDR